jgi:hypothetical protein
MLTAPAERLINILYKTAISDGEARKTRLRRIGKRLMMNSAQLICALGFNKAIQDLPEVITTLDFVSYEQLAQERNEIFTSDIYRYLTIDDILNIYAAVAGDPKVQQVMQSLLTSRLENIEHRIETTVNALIIERYKKEMQAVYNEGVAHLEFAEGRLGAIDSGFRALISEVAIIVESKLIPVADIFFRETILPEEKRKMLSRGLIPDELVKARLEDDAIPARERKMLEDYARLNIRN